MSSPSEPDNGLPVRMPRQQRKSGRHRKPDPVVTPQGAPALVLAVPGTPTGATRGLADEVLSIARSELPGLNARAGYLEGDGAEFPPLPEVLAQAAAERATGSAVGYEEETSEASTAPAQLATDTSAVVIPLLAGPDTASVRRMQQAVPHGQQVEFTDALGPHPLLAEGVHVRLSEAGLARADRARLFTVATAADGVVLATMGGAEAVQAAGITGMLLAARLAIPVLAAALDEEGALARCAEQLRSSGSQQLAVAPCLIGPEVPDAVLESAAQEAGCPVAEPLGAYPAVGKLIASTYAAKLGIGPQSAQDMPTR